MDESAFASTCYTHDTNEEITRLGLKSAAEKGFINRLILFHIGKTDDGCSNSHDISAPFTTGKCFRCWRDLPLRRVAKAISIWLESSPFATGLRAFVFRPGGRCSNTTHIAPANCLITCRHHRWSHSAQSFSFDLADSKKRQCMQGFIF